jgi:hypothetical protein
MRMDHRLSVMPKTPDGAVHASRAAGRIPDLGTSRLRNAQAAVVGVEPVISLRDICRLSSEEVEDCLAWIVRSIVCATSHTTTTPPAQLGL